MGFNTSSVWLKAALLCFALGTLLFIIGFATSKWQVVAYYSSWSSTWYGLWKYHGCISRSQCLENSVTSQWLDRNEYHSKRDWNAVYRSTQVFECIGLICAVLSLIVLFIFIFIDSMRKRSALLLVIILGFVAAVAMCIGFVIFGTFFKGADVGWSMGVAIAGAVFILIGSVFAVIDLKK